MKRTLTGIAAASIVLGTMAPAAFAGTTYHQFKATISVDGTLLSQPYAFVATDGSNLTTYMPIWYVGKALEAAGYTQHWDGKTWALTTNNPGDFSGVPVGTGNATITVNGQVVKKVNTYVAKDPAAGKNAQPTTYMPIYYVDQIFKAAGINFNWDGVNWTVSKPAPVAFAVQSVTALNAKQLQVKFTQAVDTTSAQNTANYTVTSAAGVQNTVTSATVQPDGKTVVLTLQNAYNTATNVTVTVQNVLLSGSTSVTVPFYSTAVTVNDTTPASVTGITSVTNGTTASSVTVNFSEPVLSATFKVDGVYYAATFSADRTSATISGLSLDASKSHTLDVIALTDYANNVTNVLGQSFSVTKDTVAPTASVSALNDHQILVVFSKKMATGGGAADPTTAGNIKVKDETFTDLPNAPTVAPDPKDTTGTRYIVTIPSTDPLYTNKSSRTLTLVFSNTITDYLGNALATQSATVTLNKDTVAPVINSISYKKDASGKVTDIILNLSKGAQANAAGVSSSGITVVNSNGVDVTAGFLPANSKPVADGDTSVDFQLASPQSLSGTYTFYLPAGLIKDNSQNQNQSAATTLTVDFGAPAASSFSITQADVTNPSTNVIRINFHTAVKGGAVAGSATNPSNYTLNGSPLPAGTIITLDPTQQIATITLPSKNSVATSDNNAVFTITGVQNSNGVTITPFTGTVQIVDNTAPVLQSAQIIGNQILLTYNEPVTVANAANNDATPDYSITVGGNALNLGTGGKLTAASVNGNNKEVMLTITPGTGSNWDTTKTIQITTQGSDITDQSVLANVQQPNVTVTAH